MKPLRKRFAEISVFETLKANAFRLLNGNAFLPFGGEPPAEDFLLDSNDDPILDANDDEILVPES